MCQRCKQLETQILQMKTELERTSRKLKDEARFASWDGMEDLAEGYERSADRIDKIIRLGHAAYNPPTASLWSSRGYSPRKDYSRWTPQISWGRDVWRNLNPFGT